MTSTNSGATNRRRDVFVNLAEELQIRRSGVHGDKMAANLFRFADGRDLVGLDRGAERAIYYEVDSRSFVAVRFDKHGVYAGARELLHRDFDDPSAWVEARCDDLVWVHPRYR